jgi:type I restriction-modification system DNA methylase subunit
MFAQLDIDKQENRFQTPENICKYMASLIPKGVHTILEPTPGLGNLVRAIEEREKAQYRIAAPKDFFLLEENWFDCVVMNPPFSLKYTDITNASEEVKKLRGSQLQYYFLYRAMSMSNSIIALVTWFTLADSDVRMREIRRFGLKSVTMLPRKTFQYARIQTVVLEMEKGYQKDTILNTGFHQ